MQFNLKNFEYEVICENETTDTKVKTLCDENTLTLSLSANNDKPKFVKLKWNFESDKSTSVLGDAWERSYGDLQFRSLENTVSMPWYFLAKSGDCNYCFGVKTGCKSFVSFCYSADGITALVDVRNGAMGVELNGREIELCTFVYKKYESTDSFECLCDYCKLLCDNPILPKGKIFGGNNWYYAYGESSYEEIIRDAKFQVELSKGTNEKPYQVVDACWESGSMEGPWVPNDKFKDMKKLCNEIKEIGAIPGIWIRFLANEGENITDDMRLSHSTEGRLDPSHPKVKALIKDDIERIKSWGYKLLKHDFSTKDIFGSYGKDVTDTITKVEDWHFYDKSKTSAEIVLDFYGLIKEVCGDDMMIIGCNTVSHLSAGLVEINRTGDDTSGKDFARTLKMGVNTLAFRLAQHNAFYMVDADCVGILDDNIPWQQNKMWLDLLSKSNTALFVSCTDKITDEMKNDISNAYQTFMKPHTIKPMQFTETPIPSRWLIDDKEVDYNWDINQKIDSTKFNRTR